jgi:hypothetical protein
MMKQSGTSSPASIVAMTVSNLFTADSETFARRRRELYLNRPQETGQRKKHSAGRSIPDVEFRFWYYASEVSFPSKEAKPVFKSPDGRTGRN